ncbi:MAG: thioredoxin family protein [Endomicrobiia bacterium]
MKEFAKLGIIMTPAVVIDGKVAVMRKVPTVEEIKKILSKK